MYFVDVQGTLLSDIDKSPLNGSREFISYLNATQDPYMIVTNNTKHLSRVFLEFLQKSGFEIPEASYLDPLMVIKRQINVTKIAAYGDKEFLRILTELGYELNYTDPECVCIGVKKDYTSEDFAQMIDFLLNDAKLIGMHAITLYAKDGKRYPGSGAILEMLKTAAIVPYEIVGKPSNAFYRQAKMMLEENSGKGIDFSEITMISDDVQGDLIGAKELGMKTIFVLSGKYHNAHEVIPHIAEHLRPDKICQDLHEVLDYLKETKR